MPEKPEKPIAGAGKGQSVIDWAPAYLAALAETGHCGRAAQAAGTSYTAVWERRKRDPDFETAYQEQLKLSANLLEAEAVRRAKDGLRRMKFNAKTGEPYIDPATGEPYIEHEYSDTLMLALLKRHYPELYKERQQVEHGGEITNLVKVFSEEEQADLMRKKQAAIQRRRGLKTSNPNGLNGNGSSHS